MFAYAGVRRRLRLLVIAVVAVLLVVAVVARGGLPSIV